MYEREDAVQAGSLGPLAQIMRPPPTTHIVRFRRCRLGGHSPSVPQSVRCALWVVTSLDGSLMSRSLAITIFAPLLGILLALALAWHTFDGYSACVEQRRTLYLTGELKWFAAIQAAEGFPVKSPLRAAMRSKAFLDRGATIEVLKTLNCRR